MGDSGAVLNPRKNEEKTIADDSRWNNGGDSDQSN